MKSIKILKVNYLRGPNIWTYRPVIEAWLDIGELEEFPSNTLPGFYDRIVDFLPGLVEHKCSLGVRGGFLKRLQEGTYCAHIVEHVSLELQTLANSHTTFGKARETSTRGIYKIVFRSYHERVGNFALKTAISLVEAAINNTPFDVARYVQELTNLVDKFCLGPSTAHCVDAAVDRQIPYIRLTEGNLVQLGYGAEQRRIWTVETDQTSAIAEDIASDKDMTKNLLAACGVPVPEGTVVRDETAAWQAAQSIGFPVTVKPLNANHGRGVSLDLYREENIRNAFRIAYEKGDSSYIIVEKFIEGEEHRLLVVGNQLVAAAAGESILVRGDGVHCVEELIDLQINSNPLRGEAEDYPLDLLKIDEDQKIKITIGKLGLSKDSVIEYGREILIQRNGNVVQDVTNKVHPTIARAAVLAAKAVGLNIAGVDMVMEDISKAITEQSCAVIEVNSGPGLLMHIKPAIGEGQPVGRAIINSLFQERQNGRIPIIGILGNECTHVISKLIAWIVYISGFRVGLSTKEGMAIDNRLVLNRMPSWDESRNVLINRSIQAAIFENTGVDILTAGLVYDRCSVGVVTDLGWTSEWLAWDVEKCDAFKVARTQVDVILPSGILVLNADIPELHEMASLCDGEVIYYSQKDRLPDIKEARKVILENGQFYFYKNNKLDFVLEDEVLGACQDISDESILVAIATVWGMGIAIELIVAGLQTYQPISV